MASPSRKRKAITLETEYELIQSVQIRDSPKTDIASTILINRDLIVASYQNSTTSTSLVNVKQKQSKISDFFKQIFKNNLEVYKEFGTYSSFLVCFLCVVRIRYKV